MWLPVSEAALDRGHRELDRVRGQKLRAGYRQLAGYIAEALVAEYFRDFKAEFGGPGNVDVILEGDVRLEVKAQTSLNHRLSRNSVSWAPRYKPGFQHALIFCHYPIVDKSFDAVEKADAVLVKGWISDANAQRCTVLKRGQPAPHTNGLLDNDTLEVPDIHLAPIDELADALRLFYGDHDRV